jgi:hypothetical protein
MGWLQVATITLLFYLYYTLFDITCYGGFPRIIVAALAAVSLPASISYVVLSRRLEDRGLKMMVMFEAFKAATIHITAVLAGLLARC